jgi:NitT/TauT family transport system permease protein
MSITTSPARPGFDDGPLAVLDPQSRQAARRRKIVVHLVQVGLFIFVFGGWELFARLGIVDVFFFGSPSGIVDQLVTWAQSGTDSGSLWEQIGVTLEEAVLGFIIGVTLGVVVGVSLGRSKLLSDVFAPYIKAVNAIPRIVLGTVFVVAFGLGLASKVALAVVLVFFVVFFNAFQGTREVDRNLIANARILGASKAQVTRQVVLPSALTWIMASLHTSFGFALIGAIVGEFLGAEKGLGLLVSQAKGNFNIDGIFAAMLIMAAIALIAESVISLLERRLLSWRPPQLHGAETTI